MKRNGARHHVVGSTPAARGAVSGAPLADTATTYATRCFVPDAPPHGDGQARTPETSSYGLDLSGLDAITPDLGLAIHAGHGTDSSVGVWRARHPFGTPGHQSSARRVPATASA